MKQERHCRRRSRRLSVSGRLLTLLMIASIGLSVLFCVGCASTKERGEHKSATYQKSATSDSAVAAAESATVQNCVTTDQRQEGEKKLLYATEGIPEAESKMSVAIQNLLDLPEGAGYSEKNGRATVTVEREGDRLKVTGHCDSIERKCLWYEEACYRQRQRADSLEAEVYKLEAMLTESLIQEADSREDEAEETKKPPNRWGWTLGAFIAGFATGAVITIKRRKRDV